MKIFNFLKKKNINQEKEEKTQFLGFVLLNDPIWDKEKFLADLNKDWKIKLKKEIEEQNDYKKPICASLGNFSILASIIESPIPNKEAEINAKFNFKWPEAVEVTKTHKAHIILSVSGPKSNYKELSTLLVKLISSCLKQENAIAVYQYSNVYEPTLYQDTAQIINSNTLPIYNLVWFGIYKDEKKAGVYTNGMRQFDKEEIEIYVDKDKFNPVELQAFLINIVAYILEGNVTLHPGETIGLTAEQKLPITHSKGIALEGNTLKIDYK